MAWLLESVPIRVKESIDKAGVSMEQTLLMNSLDLQNSANISGDEVRSIKMFSAEKLVAHKFVRANEVKSHFISTGCKVIDKHLGGGFVRGAITEIAGESGTGKTQFCLQAALSVQLPLSADEEGSGAVYICTEDTFPSTRLQQLLHLWPSIHDSHNVLTAGKYSDNIYINHVADAESLQSCISVQLPNLLRRRRIGLIIVDSIAGAVRSEYDLQVGAVSRAHMLKNVGQKLHEFANVFNLAVICVNQVTTVPGKNWNIVVPALGLAWANLVSTRILLHRTGQVIQHVDGAVCIAERLLKVEFSPYLEAESCPFVVTERGIQGIQKNTS